MRLYLVKKPYVYNYKRKCHTDLDLSSYHNFNRDKFLKVTGEY